MSLSQGFSRSLMLALMALSLMLASAQEENASTVTYTVKGDTLEGPEQLEAGFHSFTLVLDDVTGESWADGAMLRLHENVTPEEALEAMRNVDEAFESGDADPMAAFNMLLEKVDILGGPSQEQVIGINVEPGSYVFTANVGSGEGPPALVSKPLEVTSSSNPTPAPEVDLTVNMVDFAFTFPDKVKAGEQVWEVANRGEQLHHISLSKIKEGKTMDDVMAWIETQGEGEPAADEVLHLSPTSPGSSNYVSVNLEPGAYLALCFIPDHEEEGTGQPHFALGMIETFTVADE